MHHRELELHVDPSRTIRGDLVVPDGARGVVVFAHGSGSSRSSPRNRQVAAELQRLGLGTLLFDLLTEAEEVAERDTGHLRFDIELLARPPDVAGAPGPHHAGSGPPPRGAFGPRPGGPP